MLNKDSKAIMLLMLILLLSFSFLACSRSDDSKEEQIINKFDFAILVVDKEDNNQTINNAQVKLDDKEEETNSAGVANFSSLEADRYSLIVNAEGYQEYKGNIEVGADTQKYRVELEEKVPADVDGELIKISAGSTSQDNGDLTLDYDFKLGKYPTTFTEYEEYVDDRPRVDLPDDQGWGRGNRPVINVSWYDAARYANWLSEEEGLEPAYDDNGELKDQPEYLEGYRLPTNEEWEYAARGGANGEATIYAGSDNLNQVGWHIDNSDSTMPVGEKEANELGLYDLSGNVEEWTTTKSGSEYIVRGGAWRYVAAASEVDAREEFEVNEKNDALGFRLTRTADFDSYSLEVEVEGNGGVNIEPDRERYRAGDTITLRAEPEAGYGFVAWSGDLSGVEAEKEITLEEDMQIRAEFDELIDIKTEIEGQGRIEGETSDFIAGRKVKLEAVAAQGWIFVKWSGDLSGTDQEIEFIVEEGMEIKAEFTRAYDINIEIEGAGNVVGETTVIQGEKTRLEAVAEQGWKFVEWSGDLSGTEAEQEFVVDNDMEVKARFERKRYNLELSAENGAIDIEPDLDEYEYESEVQLEAIATDGYGFVGWGGDLSGTEAEKVISVEEDMEIIAQFGKIVDIKTEVKGEGSIEGETNELVVGRKAVLAAIADDNWAFVKWSGDLLGTDQEIEFIVEEGMEIIAEFTGAYNITIEVEGAGSVEGETTVIRGEKTRLEAIAEEGWGFLEWSGDLSATDQVIEFVVENDMELSAKFAELIADLRIPVEVSDELDVTSGWLELVGTGLREEIDFLAGEEEFFFADLDPGDYTLKGEFEIGDNTIEGEKEITIFFGYENEISLSLAGEVSIGEIEWQLPPVAPHNLSATITSDQEVKLSWEHEADDIKGYYVYRSQEADGQRRLLNNYQLVEDYQYIDSEVEAGESYWYWVRAYDQDGYTSELASVEITVEEIIEHYLDLGEDAYGPNEDAALYAVEKTADGGYIAVGYADGYQNTDDGFVVKLDSRGREEWTATYHYGADATQFYDVFETEEGDYILAGATKSDEEGYVVKIDNSGQEIWSKTFTFDGADGRFRAVTAASDGGYILGGQTEKLNYRGHGWLVKIDEDGTKVWEDAYGQSRRTMIWDIVQSDEGAYVVAADNAGSWGNDNGVIMQIDQNGSLRREQEIDNAYRLRSIVKADDGYLLAGYSGFSSWDGDGYLIKINKEGNYQWHHTFGGSDRDIKFKGIETGIDGGYILTGYMESDDYYYETDGQAAYVLKVDDQGNQDWDQVYDHSEDELLWALQPAIDGYLGVGWSRSFGTGSDKDGYVIKMNWDGEIE